MEGLAGFLGFPMAPQFPTASPGGAAVVAGGVAAATGVAAGPTTQILPAAHTYVSRSPTGNEISACSPVVPLPGPFVAGDPQHAQIVPPQQHDLMMVPIEVPEVKYELQFQVIFYSLGMK